MKQRVIIIFSLLLSVTVTAQKDPEAVKVLTEFRKNAASAPSVMMSFTINLYDAMEQQETEMDGEVVIKGDSYRLTLPDNIIISDGKTVWNFMEEVNEVTITTPDPAEESLLSTPTMLFSLFEKGYKVRLVEENSRESVIDLYPEDIRVNLIRIRLIISKAGCSLKSAEYTTRDGITVTLTSKGYDLTHRPPSGTFSFNTSDHRGVEVIDMR